MRLSVVCLFALVLIGLAAYGTADYGNHVLIYGSRNRLVGPVELTAPLRKKMKERALAVIRILDDAKGQVIGYVVQQVKTGKKFVVDLFGKVLKALCEGPEKSIREGRSISSALSELRETLQHFRNAVAEHVDQEVRGTSQDLAELAEKLYNELCKPRVYHVVHRVVPNDIHDDDNSDDSSNSNDDDDDSDDDNSNSNDDDVRDGARILNEPLLLVGIHMSFNERMMSAVEDLKDAHGHVIGYIVKQVATGNKFVSDLGGRILQNLCEGSHGRGVLYDRFFNELIGTLKNLKHKHLAMRLIGGKVDTQNDAHLTAEAEKLLRTHCAVDQPVAYQGVHMRSKLSGAMKSLKDIEGVAKSYVLDQVDATRTFLGNLFGNIHRKLSTVDLKKVGRHLTGLEQQVLKELHKSPHISAGRKLVLSNKLQDVMKVLAEGQQIQGTIEKFVKNNNLESSGPVEKSVPTMVEAMDVPNYTLLKGRLVKVVKTVTSKGQKTGYLVQQMNSPEQFLVDLSGNVVAKNVH